MSAPPGWHEQPDGRERWWDGRQWTEHYRTRPGTRDGVPGAGDERTEALDVDRTQALPAPPPSQPGYAPPSSGVGLPPGQVGYGAPGGHGPYPPPRQGMSSTAKGCLVAAVVGVVLLLAAAILGAVLFGRMATRAVEDIQSAVPTTVPTTLPSQVPTELPSIGGEELQVSVGEGFDLPRASIAPGWTLEPGDFGTSVAGMTATFTESQSLPVVFTMRFEGTGDPVDTVCSSSAGSAEATTADVSCLPLFGDVSDSDRVTVTPAF
jgi:hypothetical protein